MGWGEPTRSNTFDLSVLTLNPTKAPHPNSKREGAPGYVKFLWEKSRRLLAKAMIFISWAIKWIPQKPFQFWMYLNKGSKTKLKRIKDIPVKLPYPEKRLFRASLVVVCVCKVCSYCKEVSPNLLYLNEIFRNCHKVESNAFSASKLRRIVIGNLFCLSPSQHLIYMYCSS